MPTERDARVGDEVEVTIAGKVIEYDDQVIFALGHAGTLHLTPEDVRWHDANIVITLAVDHPSHDQPGTVRAGSAEGGRVWIKTMMDYGDGGVWWCLVTSEERTGDAVEEWDVVERPNVPALIATYARMQGDHS